MEFFKGMPYVMEMLFYDHECVGIYELINFYDDNTCDVKLKLFHPFNRHKVILEHIKLNYIKNAVLDYMKYEFLCNVETCNMLQAYEVIECFKSQIGGDGK